MCREMHVEEAGRPTRSYSLPKESEPYGALVPPQLLSLVSGLLLFGNDIDPRGPLLAVREHRG